jgi:signal transduction histidine kinase
MTQVLINLLSNALKYSPDGGEIKISLYDGDGNAYISVKDCGIGIPEDLVPNLFEKFYRVQDKKVSKIQGTGLGLTIVKKIMEYHKGGIKVESMEGKGSTFTVYMPK